MRLYTFSTKFGDLDASLDKSIFLRDIVKNRRKFLETHMFRPVDEYLRRQRFGPLDGIKILHGHGIAISEEFHIAEKINRRVNQTLRIQDWIYANEGRYSVLVVVCCNEANLTLSSTTSHLLYPQNAISLETFAQALRLNAGITFSAPTHGLH